MTKKAKVQIGDILVVSLPVNNPSGHEQEGLRPVLFLGDPFIIGNPRYDMVIVVPFTSESGDWSKDNSKLYPFFPVGSCILKKESILLLDQVRAIDTKRVETIIGSLNKLQIKLIQKSLKEMLNLN